MRRLVLLLALTAACSFQPKAFSAVVCNQNGGAAITGATWSQYDGLLVTTGSADSTHVKVSTLGLKTVTNNGWTVKAAAASALPENSTATAYLESAVNTATSFQIDSTGTALEDTVAGGGAPTGSNVDYWIDFYVMAVWDGSTNTPSSATASILAIPTQVGGLNSFRIAYQGTSSVPVQGWTVYSQNTSSTGGASVARGVFPVATTAGATHWKFNEWVRVTLHYKYGAFNVGLTEVFCNGVLSHSTLGDTTTTNTTWSTSTLAVTLPAWGTGIKWRVCPTIATYNGTDISCTPMWSVQASATDLVTRMYLPWNVASSATQGSYFTSSGTGSVATDSEYATAVGSPGRHRLIFSGNGNNPVATTFDELGTLPYNAQGWANIAFSDIYVPNGTILSVKLFKAGTSNELIRFVITGGASTTQVNAYYNGGNGYQAMALGAPGDRYWYALHLNRDGRVRLSAGDLTATYDGSAKVAYSAPLTDWTPQDVGKISLTASTTASNVEVGYIAVCRRPSFSTIDSLTAAQYTSVSPNIYSATNVHHSLPYGEEASTLPGAYYPKKEYGLHRRVLIAPLGRPGKTRRDWQQCVGSLLTHMYGCEFIGVDGGSINDVITIGTDTNSDATNQIKNNLEQFIKWAVGNDNAVWLATMLPRGRTVTITSSTNANPVVLTATAHGIAGSTITRCYISGVTGAGVGGMDTGFFISSGTITLTNANTITLPNVAGGGPSVSSTGTGGTMTGFTPQELTGITTVNGYIRSLVSKYQSKGLLSLSDIEADVTNNASNYPNTGGSSGFWQDFTHPNTTTLALGELFGAGTVARRMVQLRVTPPSPVPARRLLR